MRQATVRITMTVGAVIKAINAPYFMGKGGVDTLSSGKTCALASKVL